MSVKPIDDSTSTPKPAPPDIEYGLISLERQARVLWMMTEALDEDDPNRWPFKQVAEDMEDRIKGLKKRLALD
jgi:hypothetical protein